MAMIDTIFFWLGGVLVETVPDVTLRALESTSNAQASFERRLRIRELAQDLALGHLNGKGYCQEVIKSNQLTIGTAELESRILEQVSLRTTVLEVIKEVAERYQTWLISEYPREWLMALNAHLDPGLHLQQERLIDTADARLTRLVPDIFYALVRHVDRPMERCLIIDGDSPRAVQAVKLGFNATIYVDAKRLQRDFEMRHIWPRPNAS